MTTDKTPTTVPLLHLNGSGVRDLLEPRQETCRAITTVLELMRQMTPHMRDYYPLPEGSYEAARELHVQRLRTLEDLSEEIKQEFFAIQEQDDARKARRT